MNPISNWFKKRKEEKIKKGIKAQNILIEFSRRMENVERMRNKRIKYLRNRRRHCYH